MTVKNGAEIVVFVTKEAPEEVPGHHAGLQRGNAP